MPRQPTAVTRGHAEPGTGRGEVALAPDPGQRRSVRYAELAPFRVNGSLEAKRVVVSSEPGGREGETEDLDGFEIYFAGSDAA